MMIKQRVYKRVKTLTFKGTEKLNPWIYLIAGFLDFVLFNWGRESDNEAIKRIVPVFAIALLVAIIFTVATDLSTQIW